MITPAPDKWLSFALAFVGGYGDAVGFVLAKTFTGHVTGSLVLGAIALAAHDWSGNLAHLLAITCFLIGILLSGFLARSQLRWAPSRRLSAAMGIELLLIVISYFALVSHVAVALKSFVVCMSLALGLQNGAFQRTGGVSVHTTYLTGLITGLISTRADAYFSHSAQSPVFFMEYGSLLLSEPALELPWSLRTEHLRCLVPQRFCSASSFVIRCRASHRRLLTDEVTGMATRNLKDAWWAVLSHPVRTAIAAMASFVIARLFLLPEAYWAPITTLVITQSSLGTALAVSWQRFVGTILGALVGAVVAACFGAHVVVFGVFVLLLGFLCVLVHSDRSAYRFAGVTLAIILLIPRAEPPWQIALHRFAEVSIGIGVALLLTMLWPETADPVEATTRLLASAPGSDPRQTRQQTLESGRTETSSSLRRQQLS